MAVLPPLVITGNRIDALGPVHLLNVVLHSFCLDADRGKVQALLDKTFDAPSGGQVRYEAIGDKVFLSFAEIPKLYAVDSVENGHGYSSEIDVTLWVMAHRVDGGLFAIRWIPVYLFVDNGPAMASGREVWGFPKQMARCDFSPLGSNPAGPRSFKVEGFVLDPFAPTSCTRWAPMIGVEPIAAPPAAPGVVATLEHFAALVGERLTESFASIAGKLQAAIGMGAMTMAFLKQFPDAADPMTACYQGIIEAEARVVTLRGAGLTDDHYRAQVTSFASQPFLDELGIAPGWHDVGRGVWIDYDFILALGAEVWRAGD
ncbi:acetoacetate decarboxylase family protein [Sphingosinicellaceae bacterium]|nr:acetoacetate decarboxylase family protein [Sphingosinicellaceae bacterium]